MCRLVGPALQDCRSAGRQAVAVGTRQCQSQEGILQRRCCQPAWASRSRQWLPREPGAAPRRKSDSTRLASCCCTLAEPDGSASPQQLLQVLQIDTTFSEQRAEVSQRTEWQEACAGRAGVSNKILIAKAASKILKKRRRPVLIFTFDKLDRIGTSCHD